MFIKKAFRNIKYFVVILLALVSENIISQNIKFKRISVDDGLAAVTVKTIYQDSQDFIWIGTQDGLNRYDGYHIKTFKVNQYSKTSLPTNDINCLLEDKNGDLYIGTNGGGLSVLNKQLETFTNYKSGLGSKTLSNNSVRSILELNETQLLVATDDGMNLFDKTTKQFNLIPCITQSTTDLRFIFKSSRNRIFIASYGNGLFEYNQNENVLVHRQMPSEILNKFKNTNSDITHSEKNNLRCITEVNGKIWCGSDEGVIIFNPDTKKFEDVLQFGSDVNTKYNNRIVSFAQDKNSTFLWIGTWGGLVKYNLYHQNYTIYTHDQYDLSSLSNNNLSCLLTDKLKNLWVGTDSKGLNVYFPSSTKFNLFNFSNGLKNDYIYSAIETQDKTIWVGTEDGLYAKGDKENKFRDETNIVKKHDVKTVLSFLEDNTGRLWIGSYGQGVVIYDPKTQKTQKILGDNNLGGTVMKIIQTQNGAVWIATYGDGLYCINPQTLAIKRYTTFNGLSSDNIYTVYENTNDNSLWIGTEGGGLSVFNFATNIDKPLVITYKHLENKNSISSNTINNIYQDENGIFWIATNNGLNKFDYKSKIFSVFSEKDGLPNSYVYDVIPDKKGNLWLPTNFGLSKFNPNIVNENGNAFKNYNTKDGIQAREFNQGASFLCNDGKILVGGIAGLNYFNPNEIKENTITPKSYIYSFSRQGKEIVTDSSIIFKKYIELSYKENYFTFELITLDYVSPDKNKFMYKLEGYNDWSSPTDVRYVSYTELAGGKYTFKVKATNSDGVWNEIPYEITIKVGTPWWKTTWFYIIASIFIIASVIGFIRYRTNAIKKENKILENKVAERTKELAEKNRDITSSIEYAKRIQEAILPPLDLIYSKLKNIFILYKPKDIVSGDFYWYGEKNNFKIIAVVDCTGHGVPGAFMSMIGHNLLNQIVAERGVFDPGLILNELHKGVQSALKQGQHQSQTHTNDGMDVCLLALNTETKECLYAGAFRSLVIVNSNGDIEKIDGNKYPVGGAQLDSERTFTTHVRTLQKNDCLYMFSDGYADQFGGEKGKKFMVKRFHDSLTTIHQYSILEQHKELERQFNFWKGDYAQVDDVLVIGIKI